MRKSIWKFEVPVADAFTIDMPIGARLLAVQVQHDRPQLWAIVDPLAPTAPRAFAMRGTGHDASAVADCKHVGTFQLRGGALVFHLFDLTEVSQ